MNSTFPNMRCAAVIVAAGDGNRLPGDHPKAYRMLAGRPLLRYSVEHFHRHPQIDRVVVVYQDGHEEYLQEALAEYSNIHATHGGATRQESVHRGLLALKPHAPDYVLIHDAARPFHTDSLTGQLITALAEGKDAVIPTLPVKDTIKKVEDGTVTETPARHKLQAAQTPQAFAFDTILSLHEKAGDHTATDDAMLAEQSGINVHTIPGEARNIKITYPEDLTMAQRDLNPLLPRIGSGYDVHRLVPHADSTPNRRRMIRLCGVDIPSEVKLQGHSDADAGLHALTDALLGALALGDIGQHFPPSEPRWRGADSSIFLLEAHKFLHERNARLINADITLIAEKPRLNPYRDHMRQRIATLLDVPLHAISVKATTHETLGALGRQEGIAAHAVVSILAPEDPA